MSSQTLELIEVIEEQQALIADLLKYIPPSDATEEMKERIGRIVARTEKMKANFVDLAEIDKWAKAREKRKAEKEQDREDERQELWQPGDEAYEPDYWGAYYE